MLNDLKNRGLKDVLFFCVDGLAGFKEAISAVYPQSQIQRCVIHMLRNSFKYVNYSDLKKFSSDFKAVYHAPNESAGYSELEGLNRQYRKVTKTKSVFPSDQSLEKMLYLASENITKKWTQRYRGWDQVLNQLIVLCGERLSQYL